jgi:hypothetical protein
MSDNTRRRSAADPVLRQQLQRARSSYARRDWADAFRALSRADQIVPLEANDLERLATAAYLIGRDDGYLTALDRAYRLRLETGEHRLAVRCAFWIGLRLLFRGETSQANGWLGRARRFLVTQEQDCAEWGYVLVPTVEQHLAAGDHQGAATAAARLPKSASVAAILT